MLSVQTYGTQVTVDSVTLRGSAYLICPSGNENLAALISWVSSFQAHMSITPQMAVYLIPYKDSKDWLRRTETKLRKKLYLLNK